MAYIQVAESALKTHSDNLIDCIDKIDAVRCRINLLQDVIIEHLMPISTSKADAFHFTMESLAHDLQAICKEINAEVKS